MYKNITGAILAGGRGKRFGGAIKSKLPVIGVPVISRIMDVFTGLFEEIIIVTNNPDEYLQYDSCKLVSDEYKNTGPLGGIHAALKASSYKAVFVIAGDMPFPDSRIIVRIIDRFLEKKAEITIPSIYGRLETLHAVYKDSVIEKIEEHLSDSHDYSVRNFIEKLYIERVTLENCNENLVAMTNLNSPADLDLLNTWRSE